MSPWDPTDRTFAQTSSRILARASESAADHFNQGGRRASAELAARGLAQSGAAVRASEALADESIERFSTQAWPDLVALVRDAGGDPVPPAALEWLRDTFTRQIDALVKGLGQRLVEQRKKLHIPAERATVGVTRVGERAKRDMEIELGKLELRSSAARRAISEVVGDFLGLAKEALGDSCADAKNVAAVLVAAAFEDTIRRMGQTLAGVTGRPDLSDVLQALKTANVIVGAPFSTAQSYLKFRNDALHADWAKIDKAVTGSCLAFVEGLLAKHFS